MKILSAAMRLVRVYDEAMASFYIMHITHREKKLILGHVCHVMVLLRILAKRFSDSLWTIPRNFGSSTEEVHKTRVVLPGFSMFANHSKKTTRKWHTLYFIYLTFAALPGCFFLL